MNTAGPLIGGRWIYERVGYDQRRMAFCPNGSIGLGAAGMELFWDIRRIDGILSLDIQSQESLTCRLTRGADGVWRGRWEDFEQMPIELRREALVEAIDGRLHGCGKRHECGERRNGGEGSHRPADQCAASVPADGLRRASHGVPRRTGASVRAVGDWKRNGASIKTAIRHKTAIRKAAFSWISAARPS